jgi:hypothetical protein
MQRVEEVTFMQIEDLGQLGGGERERERRREKEERERNKGLKKG